MELLISQNESTSRNALLILVQLIRDKLYTDPPLKHSASSV